MIERTASHTMNSGIKFNLANNEIENNNKIELIAQNKDECRIYVENLNHVLSIVKTKFFSNNGNKVLISNY